MKGMRGTPLAYVIQCHVKVAQVFPGYGAYLNLDEEMITRALIIGGRTNIKLSQDSLDRDYLDYQVDTLKIENAMVYQILLKIFTDMDAYIYAKQRKGMQYG